MEQWRLWLHRSVINHCLKPLYLFRIFLTYIFPLAELYSEAWNNLHICIDAEYACLTYYFHFFLEGPKWMGTLKSFSNHPQLSVISPSVLFLAQAMVTTASALPAGFMGYNWQRDWSRNRAKRERRNCLRNMETRLSVCVIGMLRQVVQESRP